MKSIILPFVTILISFTLMGQQKITGIWNTGDDNTLVRITDANGEIEGKILSSKNEKAIPGTLLIKDCKYNNGSWDAALYSPRQDRWFNATLQRIDNELEIMVKVGFYKKKLVWLKVE